MGKCFFVFFFNQFKIANASGKVLKQCFWFINCGDTETTRKAPKLMDWEQDARAIVADVNKVAGMEIRALTYLHWWTFLSWFHAIGEGQLSTVVSIRDKLRRGKKLEQWEKEHGSGQDMVPLLTR